MKQRQPGVNLRKAGFVIEKDFQYRFTLKLCLYGGSLLFLYGGLMLFFVKANYESLIKNALTQMPSSVPALQREFRFLSVLLVAAMVFLIGLLFGLGLVLTQKIAGPMLALQKRLREFGDGKPGVRLRLRKGDEFHNLESVFNAAMESHDKRSSLSREELLRLRVQLEKGEVAGARKTCDGLLGPGA